MYFGNPAVGVCDTALHRVYDFFSGLSIFTRAGNDLNMRATSCLPDVRLDRSQVDGEVDRPSDGRLGIALRNGGRLPADF
jgi:hypothetical protein